MGLASALSTALTGLTASETTIDVVGNNLANSNTVGFKSSTASFSTQFLQTLSLGSQPTAANGGTNPRQVGLGTMVSDITPNFNQGTLEISSNPTDLAIQGDGFFIVEGGQGETLYTRNGIFKFNSQNEMVTITGNRLLGFGIDDQFQIQRTTLVPITIPLGAAAVAQPTANVYLEGTLSPTGDVATQAQRIQTGILGDGTFSAPPDSGDVSNAQQPSVLTVNTASVPGATTLVAGDTYEYKLVWADDYALGNPNPTESRPSDTFTRTVANNGDSINMSNLPTSPPTTSYTHLRVYRRKQGAASTDYNYIGQVATGTTTFSDTVSDAAAAANPVLDEQVISGNYSYYVTYVAADGTESRPGPLSGPTAESRSTISPRPTSPRPTGEPGASTVAWPPTPAPITLSARSPIWMPASSSSTTTRMPRSPQTPSLISMVPRSATPPDWSTSSAATAQSTIRSSKRGLLNSPVRRAAGLLTPKSLRSPPIPPCNS